MLNAAVNGLLLLSDFGQRRGGPRNQGHVGDKLNTLSVVALTRLDSIQTECELRAAGKTAEADRERRVRPWLLLQCRIALLLSTLVGAGRSVE